MAPSVSVIEENMGATLMYSLYFVKQPGNIGGPFINYGRRVFKLLLTALLL